MSSQEDEPSQSRRPRARLITAVSLAVVVIIGAGAAILNFDPREGTGLAAQDADAQVSSPVSPADEEKLSGNELLLALASRLTDSQPDKESGTYSMLHVKVWGLGSATEYRTWKTPDAVVQYGLIRRQPSVSGASFDLSKVKLDFTGRPVEVIDYRCIHTMPDLALSGAGDPVTELDWYFMHLRGGRKPATPSVLVDQVISLNRDQLVPTPVRAAVLRWLAKIAGWTQKHGTDLAGRPGVVFELADGENTVGLVFDPVTGQLLASDFRYSTKSLAYTLFDGRARTMNHQPEIVEPTPASVVRPGQSPGNWCQP